MLTLSSVNVINLLICCSQFLFVFELTPVANLFFLISRWLISVTFEFFQVVLPSSRKNIQRFVNQARMWNDPCFHSPV